MVSVLRRTTDLSSVMLYLLSADRRPYQWSRLQGNEPSSIATKPYRHSTISGPQRLIEMEQTEITASVTRSWCLFRNSAFIFIRLLTRIESAVNSEVVVAD